MRTIDAILYDILATKRPTNNPKQNLEFVTALLDNHGIVHDVDIYGNVIVDNGGVTCFTSHTDTVDNKLGTNALVIDKQGMISVKGGGILGADCGSGMYIMIKMIQANVHGLYVFFATEEQGRIGSSAFSMPKRIKHCVSFDRKGTNNLITHQMGERGCSESFAHAFIDKFGLPFVEDPTGSFTDSYSFFDVVPECINLSVGYYDQHSKQERQDLAFLERMVDACIAMPWHELPADRVPVPAYETDYYGLSTRSKYLSEDDLIEDFVYDNPTLVATLLMEYGLTYNDLLQYKQEMETYASDKTYPYPV